MAISAALLTLIGSLVIAAFAIWLMLEVKRERSADAVTVAVYRTRFRYFVTLTAVLVVALGLSLSRLPYPTAEAQSPQGAVLVSGMMWAWHYLDTQGDQVYVEDQVLKVPAGEVIEFRVTAADVTHGFGIYDAAGVLLAQTQAMPGYVNLLHYTVERAGSYHILCMEYCGYAHHNMVSRIQAEDRRLMPGESAGGPAR